MLKDQIDPTHPRIGNASRCLGVRTIGPHADVDLDGAGQAILNRKGMSVSEDWRALQPHLIPIELDDGVNGGCGKAMAVFVHGQGTGGFVESTVATGLELWFKHG